MANWLDYIHNVPHVSTRGCCEVCLGACNPGFNTCFKCGYQWASDPAFSAACDLIVPCSVALSPGNWYRAMLSYKDNRPDYRALLSQVLELWMAANAPSVTAALTGPPELVMVVPSTTRPMPTPLFDVVSGVPTLASGLVDGIAYIPGSELPSHRALVPWSFAVNVDVSDRRVVLIEDTWVSGANPLSAAMAIRAGGAAALALVPIARMVEAPSMTVEYATAATPQWLSNSYPR